MVIMLPGIDHIHVLLIVMQELVSFGLVYVQSVMKSHNHETRGSMNWTGVRATCMIKVLEIDNTKLTFMSNYTN